MAFQDGMLPSATEGQGIWWRQGTAAVYNLFLTGLRRREEQA